MSAAVKFIRKNGKVIPIRGAGEAVKHVASSAVMGAAGIAVAAAKKPNKQKIKVNRAADLAGLGLSIASGAIAAATFATPKGLALGHAAAKGLDVVGITANVASVAGHGNTRDRVKQAAKQEARNFAIGNAVFAAGVLGIKKNRQAAVGYAQKALGVFRKALRVI